jgi:proprotein convertase subtilisin/kexin type 5
MNPIGYKCACINGYELENGVCIDNCGDGLIINDECDDGNTANNDGCSSKCKK